MHRRKFVKTVGAVSIAGIMGNSLAAMTTATGKKAAGKRVGIIGLDTSHAVAFTKALNAANPDAKWQGYQVVTAYPYGSRDIRTSVERMPGYTEDVKKLGVKIAGSIPELLRQVDVVFLETNDGRLHLEQALQVLKARKPLFIDKPMAASLKDAKAIFNAARQNNTPVFSSSSLRFITGMSDVKDGKIGKVTGAETYSPAKLEPTHPDLFWYGIHGVETLFAAMGTGCKTVRRVHTTNTDVVIGTWEDGRIGTFRGTRSGKDGYGGIVFGEKGPLVLGAFTGYDPLLVEITRFFETGVPPVTEAETLEILAFMEAADISKKKDGNAVDVSALLKR
ncbi:Gfo/Idh/MocA family protein [Niabella beijingensis]|uniref:Gfo/Idh/MocA family protein n=1 Tax=Niabella beijingensis TaxID=2872700 RepID=UPI001CBB12C1|nr:Gfo/Idh/MocA family oxidoreductase [Niabella beijingensis]MBZ4188617.1 Gfo/Idh/MocA family oxidoreductase [Niabella beijingensis]